MAVWYTNIPEETQYFFKGSNRHFYIGYAYVFLISFVIFIIFGIIYLMKKQVPRFISYILIGDLILSTFYVWHYSTVIPIFYTTGILNYISLVLFAYSIFKLSIKEQEIERT